MSRRSQNRTKRSSLNKGDVCSTQQARTGNQYRNIRRRTIPRVRDVRHLWKSYSARQECRSRAGASTAKATIPALTVCGSSPWASSTQRLRQPGTPRIWQKWLIWQRRRQHNHYRSSRSAVAAAILHPRTFPNVRTSQQPYTKVTAATTSTSGRLKPALPH